jgi:hypothetical protein
MPMMPVVSLSKEHPGCDCHGRVERGARRYKCGEARVEGGHALEAPEAGDYAEYDGYRGGGIFEARTIANRRRGFG